MHLASKGNCIACGALPRDAELRKAGAKQSSCTNFSIKVDERVDGEKKEAVWLKCTCWNRLAKYAAGLEKGDVVFVAGKLREYSYTSKTTGEVVNCTELVCEFVSPQAEAYDATAQGIDAPVDASFSEVDDDGELPF